MSTKYLSNDPDCMAEAARRFNMLFGHFPDFIGVNRKNAETCRGSIRFPMIKEYIDTLMCLKPGIDDELPQAPAITMQEIPIKPYDGVGFYDFILWSRKTGAVTPERVFGVSEHVKETPKKPYAKVTIYHGTFTQDIFFEEYTLHHGKEDTTFWGSSVKYSVIDPVD